MNSSIVTACAIGALNLFCMAAAHAQSLRCNGDLAGVGDTKASVMNKCGKPALTDWYCKAVIPTMPQWGAAGSTPVVPSGSCERIDEWTYFPGSGQFVTTFRFEGSVVTAVRYGDRIN